jgi:hypothetical protein
MAGQPWRKTTRGPVAGPAVRYVYGFWLAVVVKVWLVMEGILTDDSVESCVPLYGVNQMIWRVKPA